ncbi:MAG: glycosyltransferase [Candidatus Omnitrophica bacterium]|nr:glycosyltransferase [Candidatus Omnitrophota bacterium]
MIDPVFAGVIIPVYNDKDNFKICLAALCAQTYPRDKFEIMIIDDGSTDGLGEWLESYRKPAGLDIKYFYQKNKGPSSARNLGIKYSRGDILAFIDSDCVPQKDWLEEVLRGYASDNVAGAGGVIEALPTGSKVSRYCAYVKMNRTPKIDPGGIAYLITGNASFRRDCLIAAGGFDERFDFPGGEEPDLCYRLKQKGYIFQFNHKAVVYNAHKQNLSEFTRTYFNYGKGQSFLMARKMSKWDLVSVSRLKWPFYFLKMLVKLFFIFIANLKTILRFIKIPFYGLYYYGKGLSIADSFRYAIYDYLKSVFFVLGCFCGYFIGKFRGFKRT